MRNTTRIHKTICKHLKIYLLLGIVAILSLTSCDNDDPKVTKIFGTVTIDNVDTWANWIDSGELQLTLFPEFSLDPPAGWGSVPDGFFGPGVPGGTFALGAPFNSQNPTVLKYVPGQNQYAYEIEADPGTYSALALGFRHDFITDASKRTATLGVHWDTPNNVSHGVVLKVDVGGGVIVPIFDFPAPVSFTIDVEEEKEVNFKADFNFVNSWYQ